MVEQYYVDQVTQHSEKELEAVFQTVEPPVCLLGGWAVHLQVNPGYREENGQEYIGSRDIDLGIHIPQELSAEELQESEVGESLSNLKGLGYERSRFGFVQHFHRDTGERLTEEKAQKHLLHETFELYIDIIPDTDRLESFEAAFGFQPPAETLLQPVFGDDAAQPLADHVDWNHGGEVLIPGPELLAAMKVRSLSDRDKGHKKVKDIADLHSLLWHVKTIQRITSDTVDYLSREDLNNLESALSDQLINQAASLLQTDPVLIRDTINQLLQEIQS